MLWSCSTWSFMIATSGATTIILETAFLCNALINLGKCWKIKIQILLEEWRWYLFPETRFQDNLLIPFVKYPHLGNRQALAVQLFNRAWLDGGWPSHAGTPYCISCLRQQPSGVDRRCQIWPIRGYTRIWYTGTASFEKISQAFPRRLPQSPLVFSRSFVRFIFRSRSTIWTPGTG